MFGLVTSLLNPNTRNSRLRHLGSSSTLASSDTLDEGLERPESDNDEDSGDRERGERRYTLLRPNNRYSVFRLTKVPPNSSVTTTSGSIKAPAPIATTQRG